MKGNISELFKGGTLFIQSDMPLNLIDITIKEDEPDLNYSMNGSYAVLSLDNYMYLGKDKYSISSYVDLINKIKSDPEIKGLLFNIYSGGGVDVAGELLRVELESLSKIKPTIAYGHYVASGAYLASLGCNLIIASSGLSRFGSIGSYISLDKWYKEIYDIIRKDVFAEASTEKQLAWRNYVSDDDITLYQEAANESANYFINQVRKYRTGVSEDALKGSMYMASQAKSLGLIDGIGNLQYAISRLNSLIKNYS